MILPSRPRLLFTGGGGAGNEAINRLLGNRYDLFFTDADQTNICPSIPVERTFQIPLAKEPNFVRDLHNICLKNQIDLLIPGVDEELLLISENAKIFCPTKLLLPETDFISMMLDKLHLIRFLNEMKILAPKTHLMSEYIPQLSFPFIVKPRQGRGSRGVQVINNKEQYSAYRASITGHFTQYILQEKAVGIEYTVLMAADTKGELKAVVPVKVYQKKGITILAETENNKEVIQTCQKIHSQLSPMGCYNIQLILTSKGTVYPFEINPRVSTTFCLGLASGVNPIELFFESSKSQNLQSFKSVRLQRKWYNHFKEIA
jgi:carbamoyl-phosphate synthase large subunit